MCLPSGCSSPGGPVAGLYFHPRMFQFGLLAVVLLQLRPRRRFSPGPRCCVASSRPRMFQSVAQGPFPWTTQSWGCAPLCPGCSCPGFLPPGCSRPVGCPSPPAPDRWALLPACSFLLGCSCLGSLRCLSSFLCGLPDDPIQVALACCCLHQICPVCPSPWHRACLPSPSCFAGCLLLCRSFVPFSSPITVLFPRLLSVRSLPSVPCSCSCSP